MTAPLSPPPAVTAATDPPAGHVPIAIVTTTPVAESDLVTLFTIDGEPFKIPARPRANLMLQALEMVRDIGPELANVALLELMLGRPAFARLAACDALTEDQLKDIARGARRLALGAAEEMAGN